MVVVVGEGSMAGVVDDVDVAEPGIHEVDVVVVGMVAERMAVPVACCPEDDPVESCTPSGRLGILSREYVALDRLRIPNRAANHTPCTCNSSLVLVLSVPEEPPVALSALMGWPPGPWLVFVQVPTVVESQWVLLMMEWA